MTFFLRRLAFAAALPAAALLSLSPAFAQESQEHSQEHGGAGHEMGGMA
jgi:hypothetical protein